MRFYVAIHRPKDYNHSQDVTREVMNDIDKVNDDMVDAGIRVFVGGLRPQSESKSIHRGPDGTLTTTDGPYLETKEYIDGFWVLEVQTVEDAVEWGKKAAAACRGSVEVRPFH